MVWAGSTINGAKASLFRYHPYRLRRNTIKKPNAARKPSLAKKSRQRCTSALDKADKGKKLT
ncbi:hypothetical protein DJ031_04105 [bacterium endosymbiont of Escarpia laminata]|nr:MAG: hypothetical protein DJ031_04105 [bacterium endosymbiont of Escarpia laminata]